MTGGSKEKRNSNGKCTRR
uniref:Uncharacterized protein n=1 Tax=Arundo donax TaxID=35708 RepID=A0A0A8ZII8_ARUDO